MYFDKKEKKRKRKGCELMLMANSLLPKQILTTCSTETPKRMPTKQGKLGKKPIKMIPG
jgi:hypothetical protein